MENEKLVYILTHAKDNLELAAIPFKLAGGAMAMDVAPVIFLQAEAVRLAVKGYLDEKEPRDKELKDFIKMYISFGNKFYLCSPCLKERGITEDQLIEGAVVAGAAKLTEAVLASKNVLTY